MRNKNRLIFIGLSLLLFSRAIQSQDSVYQSRQTAITNAIQKVSPAVASIDVVQLREYSTNSLFDDPFFRQLFPYELHRERVKSTGSGVVISPDGYVITNHHVIADHVDPKYEGYSMVYVTTKKEPNVEIPAKVIGFDI